MKKGLITGKMISTPYDDGHFYWFDGKDWLLLADGTIFILNDIDEKGIKKLNIRCNDSMHAGICSFYMSIERAFLDLGVYIQPFWSFRKNHGGLTGFSVGDDFDDDLPKLMEIQLNRMSNVIYRFLLDKDMFPKDSALSNVVKSCNGDGYRALKAIIFHSHPAFHPQPSTLITAYPKQRGDSTLLDYYQLFLDFQQLRAYVMNIELTLDDESELDVFIKNAKYGEYLNRVTRDERTIRSLRYKYKGPQAIETLSMFLNAPPDSPYVLDKHRSSTTRSSTVAQAPHRRFPSRLPTRSPTNTAQVHQIEIIDDDPVDDSDPKVALDTISVPDDRNSKSVFAQDFLRAHYVWYCQQLCHDDAAARAQALGPDSCVPTNTRHTPIHFVDTLEDDDRAAITDDESDIETDFQLGRV